MNDAKREEKLADLQAELKKSERSRNMSLVGFIYTAIVIVGSLLIDKTTWCSNETLKFVSETVLSILPSLNVYTVADAVAYALARKKCIELRQQIQEISDTKTPGNES